MNKQLMTTRFAKAITTYDDAAQTQRIIARKMLAILQQYTCRPYQQILEIGCGTGIYSRLLLNAMAPNHLLLNDICPAMKHRLEDLLNHGVSFAAGDAELMPFAPGWQLITSCSALQWLNDLPGFFAKCHNLLTNGGCLAFSTFGPRNLAEITTLTGHGLAYLSLTQLKSLLAPYFEVIAGYEEYVQQVFPSPTDVLYHLKHTGVTGLAQQTWTKGALQRFCVSYTEQFSRLNGVGLTYHPIYLVAVKKER